ncbi:hypothetical protein [Clostridium ljungdahlii]|uniref:hypothetical protein n=1 Tax=Clostridium ljungdahlii TaxID=1538 RepID=UPI0012E964C5|nr:hypothetical protein [Clostridium ljungdahlii]
MSSDLENNLRHLMKIPYCSRNPVWNITILCNFDYSPIMVQSFLHVNAYIAAANPVQKLVTVRMNA